MNNDIIKDLERYQRVQQKAEEMGDVVKSRMSAAILKLFVIIASVMVIQEIVSVCR